MNKWIDINTELPKGEVLVYLYESISGSKFAVANYQKDSISIAGYPHFEMPKVLFWKDLCEPPNFLLDREQNENP